MPPKFTVGRQAQGSLEAPRPDPEVPKRAQRRHFSAPYKLRILEEVEAILCNAACHQAT